MELDQSQSLKKVTWLMWLVKFQQKKLFYWILFICSGSDLKIILTFPISDPAIKTLRSKVEIGKLLSENSARGETLSVPLKFETVFAFTPWVPYYKGVVKMPKLSV